MLAKLRQFNKMNKILIQLYRNKGEKYFGIIKIIAF